MRNKNNNFDVWSDGATAATVATGNLRLWLRHTIFLFIHENFLNSCSFTFSVVKLETFDLQNPLIFILSIILLFNSTFYFPNFVGSEIKENTACFKFSTFCSAANSICYETMFLFMLIFLDFVCQVFKTNITFPIFHYRNVHFLCFWSMITTSVVVMVESYVNDLPDTECTLSNFQHPLLPIESLPKQY